MRRRKHTVDEPFVRRRIFPSWSIAIPPSLIETFDDEGGYWHAYTADRSVSMSAIALTEDDRPVARQRILERMLPTDGERIDLLPPGLAGWAVTCPAVPPARAGRLLQGMLARDGSVAIVTITCDDPAWASAIWTSIRSEDLGAGAASRALVRRGQQRLQ
jgi:hypothetical protein